MKAVNLKTEYLENPIGIDFFKPRFSWQCEDGIEQSAFCIRAVFDNGDLAWDSGKIQSRSMTHIEYGGVKLKSRDIVIWKVLLWDENDEQGKWSEQAVFELGFLSSSDWKASWITAAIKTKRGKRYPVDYFKKNFIIGEDIKKARLYITACGIYEANINGKRAGDFYFAPGFTDYRKRMQYQAYDITGLIKKGANDLEVQLADGWYRGSLGAWGKTGFYGKVTKLLCQIEVTYDDGRTRTIVSDDSFSWSNDGPIRFADLKDGEKVDARRIPSFKGMARLSSEKIVPTASNNVSVKEKERFRAVALKSPAGRTILDFGQNIAGYIEFGINAKAGQMIRLRFGEMLDENGEFTQKNMQLNNRWKTTPLQEVEYTCKDGKNHYKTKFAVFGFRYVLVETECNFNAGDFEAIAVYSDMGETGGFECSNEDINKFVNNTLWSMKGNFLDVPTDCPTRERAGWTGDAQIFFNTGSILMNTPAFFRKFMLDITDRQSKNGKVHCIVPSVGNELFLTTLDGCVGWADAVIYIPYRFWKLYGDRKVLEDFYPAMKDYSLFMINRTGKTGIFGKPVKGPHKKYTYNKGQHFGEWLEPKDVIVETWKDIAKPRPEEATAYLAYSMKLMKEIAKELDKTDDIALYAEYENGAKKAYGSLFLKDNDINTGRQSKLVRPLALDLLDRPAKDKVFDRLVESIEKRDYHIGTGFLSTPFILPLLTRYGREDIAYKMIEKKTEPSWLYEVACGATTVWESWDGKVSRNHYSPGSVCEWLFTDVCGINITGVNKFTIKPVPGGSLTYASATYKSIFGKVMSSWKITGDKMVFDVSVPPNTQCTLILPNGLEKNIKAGLHSFEIKKVDSRTPA